MARFGLLASTLCLERKHKACKELAVNVKTSIGYESSLTRLLLSRHGVALEDEFCFIAGTYIRQPSAVPSNILPCLPHGDWSHGKEINVCGMTYHVGDYVFFDQRGSLSVLRIEAIVANAVPEFFVIGPSHELRNGAWYARSLIMVAVDCLRSPCIWGTKSCGGVRCLDIGPLTWAGRV